MARNSNSMIAAALAGFLLSGGAAAAQDYSQLAAAAGLSPSEARGMTLPQIAAHFFNRGADNGDMQPIPAAPGQTRVSGRELRAEDYRQLAAAAGLSPSEARGLTLEQIAVHFFNRGADNGDQRPIPPAAGQTRVSARDAGVSDPRYAQLIAAARLSPEEAAGMSLQEITARFLERSKDPD